MRPIFNRIKISNCISGESSVGVAKRVKKGFAEYRILVVSKSSLQGPPTQVMFLALPLDFKYKVLTLI